MASIFESDLHDVREGFLCPVCHVDQGSSSQLQLHYEIAHLNEASNPTAGVTLKDLLDKARRKLLKKEIGDDWSEEAGYHLRYDYVMVYHQEVGVTRRHMEYFRQVRHLRTDRNVIETNKLLHRLDKLLTETPSDPNKRKAHEKAIVMWAANEDVPSCPNCAKAFSLTRRKHHCRLCGYIMCAQCSEFISYSYARLLTNPAEPDIDVQPRSSLSVTNSPVLSSASSLPRNGSSASLNSLLNSNSEFQMRICPFCKQSLDRWDEQLKMQNFRPDIVVLYEKLKMQMDEASKMQISYVKMIDSLTAGETNYNLKQAQGVKTKLAKLADNIEFLAKKVLVLGLKDGDVKPHSSAIQLQRAIYSTGSNFLNNKLLGLPPLPSEEDVTQYREQRRRQIQEQIDREKKAALELQKRVDYQTLASLSQKEVGNIMKSDSGWTPQSRRAEDADNVDPIEQQIKIIENYIKQAMQAQKLEEVAMLEKNLLELKQEQYKNKDEDYFS